MKKINIIDSFSSNFVRDIQFFYRVNKWFKIYSVKESLFFGAWFYYVCFPYINDNIFKPKYLTFEVCESSLSIISNRNHYFSIKKKIHIDDIENFKVKWPGFVFL